MVQIDGGPAPTFREWLATRGAGERLTLARLWHVDAESADNPQALADAMLQRGRVQQLVASLSPQERAALRQVQERGGSIPAAVLEREYGRVRIQSDYPNVRAFLLALDKPAGPTERLYILGLLHQARERARPVYVIPGDVLELLPPAPLRGAGLCLEAAEAPPRASVGDPRLLERDLLTLLGLAQEGQLEVIPAGGLNKASLLRLARQWDAKAKLQGITREEHWPYVRFLHMVAAGAGLLRVDVEARLRPTREALAWMRLPALARARRLLGGWVASEWDELTGFLGLKIQNAYRRDLRGAKRALLGLLGQMPPGVWVSLDELVAEIKRVAPDFARSEGDYYAWRIENAYRQPLDGFEHWDLVEGEQIRAIAGGTLRWLGLTDLGMRGEEPICVRVNALGAALLAGGPAPAEPPVEPLIAQPNFEVLAPAFALPYARFQLGRIAERTGGDGETMTTFRLTKRSVQQALEGGISHEEITGFLEEQTGRALPQNVAATLSEWAGAHGQVSMRKVALLEAQDAALLEQIRRDKRIRLPSVEELSGTTWALPEGDAAGVAERLRKAGYGLAGGADDGGAPLKENDLTVLYAALRFYAEACARMGIDGDVSGALHQRVARLLPERQINRAIQMADAALARLDEGEMGE